jgi:hypothetical protein
METIKRKLNGWQRLWIVFCGLYLIAIGVTMVRILHIAEEKRRSAIFALATIKKQSGLGVST